MSVRSPNQRTHPHREHAGFVFGGAHATAYVAEEQGMDDEGGEYAVVCRHSSIVNVSSKKDAKVCARYPSNFCSECVEAAKAEGRSEPDLVAEALEGK